MIVGGTGHQDIPPHAVPQIRRTIDNLVGAFSSALEGVSALAIGADQLFARSVIRNGGRLRVIVPSRQYETTFEGPERDQFEQLLASADEIEILDYPEPSEDAFLAAGIRVVDLSDLVVAVWDGKRAQGRGGTGDIVAYARSAGKPVEVVWPEGLAR